jgi:organic radical activating enzyme
MRTAEQRSQAAVKANQTRKANKAKAAVTEVEVRRLAKAISKTGAETPERYKAINAFFAGAAAADENGKRFARSFLEEMCKLRAAAQHLILSGGEPEQPKASEAEMSRLQDLADESYTTDRNNPGRIEAQKAFLAEAK